MMELHLDFMFLGPKEMAGETIPCLVVRELLTKMVMAAAAPRKSTGTYIAKRVVAFLAEVGCMHNDIVVKSDQEPAICSIINEVGRLRAAAGGGRFIVENSPVGSSASNGMVERAIQSVQGQVRVMKLALERRLGFEIPHRHAMVPWIVEYAGFLLNRFEVSHDGKTAYERLKGKKAKTLGIEFGEAIHWRMKPAGGALGKLSSLWEDGVFLGVRGKSGELVVGDRHGVWKTRTIRRKPFDERWSKENLELVVGVPWRTSETDPQVDGEPLEVIRPGPRIAEEDKERGQEAVPRSFWITKADMEEHGYSARCPGCTAVLRGRNRQGHSTGCRKRFEELLRGTDKYKRAEGKFEEFLAKTLEKEDEMREKKRARREDEEATTLAKSEVQRRGEEATLMEYTGGPSSSSSATTATKRPNIGDDTQKESDESDRKRRAGAEKDSDMRIEDDGEEMMAQMIEESESPTDRLDEIIDEVFDERTGENLDTEMVRRSRLEELTFMDKVGLYEPASLEECFRETGRQPISTRWVDVNKGSEERPDVRSRLVARDFKPKGERDRGDLFAAMPPLEAKKMLFRMAAGQPKEWRGGKWEKQKLMFIDVKKAHLNGVLEAGERAYVTMPGCKPGTCARLKKWLYGMRPAASAWEKDFSEKLAASGLIAGKSAPTVFFDPTCRLRCVVHGDDFTFLGWQEDLFRIRDAMKSFYELKVRGILGEGTGDCREIVILNRRLTWSPEGPTYEADPSHAEKLWARRRWAST